jgi:hypothetical protein
VGGKNGEDAFGASLTGFVRTAGAGGRRRLPQSMEAGGVSRLRRIFRSPCWYVSKVTEDDDGTAVAPGKWSAAVTGFE